MRTLDRMVFIQEPSCPGARRIKYESFVPAWWEPWRWLRWLWLRWRGRRTGTLRIQFAVDGGEFREVDLRVMEVVP